MFEVCKMETTWSYYLARKWRDLNFLNRIIWYVIKLARRLNRYSTHRSDSSRHLLIIIITEIWLWSPGIHVGQFAWIHDVQKVQHNIGYRYDRADGNLSEKAWRLADPERAARNKWARKAKRRATKITALTPRGVSDAREF